MQLQPEHGAGKAERERRQHEGVQAAGTASSRSRCGSRRTVRAAAGRTCRRPAPAGRVRGSRSTSRGRRPWRCRRRRSRSSSPGEREAADVHESRDVVEEGEAEHRGQRLADEPRAVGEKDVRSRRMTARNACVAVSSSLMPPRACRARSASGHRSRRRDARRSGSTTAPRHRVRRAPRSAACRSAPPSASRLVSGSSSSTISGEGRNVIAIRSRWRWPIDMRSTRRSASSRRSNGVDRLLDRARERRAGHHRDPRPELELVPDGEPGVQATVAGGQERDEPLVAGAVLAGRDSPDLGAAAVGLDQPGGDAQHGGLADAVAPTDPGGRPGASVEVEARPARAAGPCASAC